MTINYKSRDSAVSSKLKNLINNYNNYYKNQKPHIQQLASNSSTQSFNIKINNNNLDPSNNYSSFNKKAYSYVDFSNTKFGKLVALSEDSFLIVENIDFLCVTFESCIFQNIVFKNCKFAGCKFKDCNTSSGHIIFRNCVLRWSNLDSKYEQIDIPVIFKNSTLHVSFYNCFADNMLFEECHLVLSRFDNCEMPNSIFSFCNFYNVYFLNSDINGLAITNYSNPDFIFYSDVFTHNFDNEIYVSKYDKKLVKTASNEQKRNLAKMYYSLYKMLQQNNINDEISREYYYLYNYYSMCIKKNIWNKIVYRISWAFCGFGERIGRFLIWFLSLLIFSAIGYMFGGLSIGNNHIMQYFLYGEPASFKQIILDFLTSLHFSIITFSTVGYGNITPYGLSHIISAIQIILGIVFIAIFTSVIIKKLIK